jgi:hypothetical protein
MIFATDCAKVTRPADWPLNRFRDFSFKRGDNLTEAFRDYSAMDITLNLVIDTIALIQ